MKTIITLIFLTFCCINSVTAQWINQGMPSSQLNDLFFINSNTGWGCGTTVVKTTNGGINWIGYEDPEGFQLSTIYFLNANTGFIGGDHFYKSTNGGIDWQLLNASFQNITKFSFVNSSTGWAACRNAIIKTTDGGNNWVNTFPGSANFESVNFININTGWACGNNGFIIKTTNGGTNWNAQTTGTTSVLRDINFSNANTGRAAGSDKTFLRTTNGGTNWTLVPGPGSNGNFYLDLHFINDSTGWIGSYEEISFTSNNGTSWLNVTPPQGGSYFTGISFIAPGTLYTTTSRTAIYRSNTGGFNLTAPNLTLTPATTSAINLSWTNNSNEDKFMIERRTDESGWSLIDSVGANITSYQNTGLSYNTDYYYRVYAKSLTWSGGTSNEPRARTKLNAPSNISPVNDTAFANTTPTLSWSSVNGGFYYDCEIATDAGFTNIIYTRGNDGSTSQVVPAGLLQNSTRYYWRSKALNLITYSDYSAASSFIVQDPNYGHNIASGNNLYYFANSTSGANLSPSKPIYNWRDTTGSTSLIVNRVSVAPLGLGNTDDGRFDLIGMLPTNNTIKFFGINYQNVYIGTNGIISFSLYTPSSGNTSEPSDSGIPQGAIASSIFPFWTDLYLQSTAVGSRLSYKVTPTELIITFSRASVYAPGHMLNNNLYITFQIVIQHSASPSINSKIDIFYNYAETGSDFLTRMNNGSLPRHLVGLQGSNSSTQVVNYRFQNSSYIYPFSGPIFSSNLALAFGPDAAALPVELSSFTSQVNGNSVKLNWATANEINNSGFEIERTSANENNWKKISFVNGNGTTNESKNYSYEDKNVSSGKYQYRLKQIDFNGNYEYHALANEVEIGVPKKFNLSQNYPNPFNPTTKINYELPITNYVSIKIYDLTGKEIMELVNENKAAGYYTVEFNGSNLASGMYFYRIQAGDFSAVKKMVLVK